MLFCQLGHTDSLREICNGLSCCLGKLVHLGIAKAPKKSTLSYANEHRPAALYQELFYTALERFRTQQQLGIRKRTFRFKNPLLSLDSTTISSAYRSSLGPVPPHQGRGQSACATGSRRLLAALRAAHPARASDVRMAHQFDLPPGSIVASIAATTTSASSPAGSPAASTSSFAPCTIWSMKSSSHGNRRRPATSFPTNHRFTSKKARQNLQALVAPHRRLG